MKPSKPNPRDLVPVAVILLLAVLSSVFTAGLFRKNGALTAEISVNGNVTERIVLSSLPPEGRLLTVRNAGVTLTLLLTPDGAAVTDADCPGLDCVRTGMIKKAGRSIVCLPGKIAVTLTGTKTDGLDFITE